MLFDAGSIRTAVGSPIATPLTMSGFVPSVANTIAGAFKDAGFVPMSGGMAATHQAATGKQDEAAEELETYANLEPTDIDAKLGGRSLEDHAVDRPLDGVGEPVRRAVAHDLDVLGPHVRHHRLADSQAGSIGAA